MEAKLQYLVMLFIGLQVVFIQLTVPDIVHFHFFFEALEWDKQIHMSGLSHPFLGMGPGPMELGKLAVF